MRGVTKFKLKPKTAIKLSSHIKKLPLSHRIIACVIVFVSRNVRCFLRLVNNDFS